MVFPFVYILCSLCTCNGLEGGKCYQDFVFGNGIKLNGEIIQTHLKKKEEAEIHNTNYK